jgi:hypothetical protein
MAFMDDESAHRSMIPSFRVFLLEIEIIMALFIYFEFDPALLPIALFYVYIALVVVLLVLVCFDTFIRRIPAKPRQFDLSDLSGNGALFIRVQN